MEEEPMMIILTCNVQIAAVTRLGLVNHGIKTHCLTTWLNR